MSCCNRGSDKVYTHTHTHTYTLYVGKKRMRNKKARVLSVLYLRDISRADVGNALSIPLAATLPCKILIQDDDQRERIFPLSEKKSSGRNRVRETVERERERKREDFERGKEKEEALSSIIGNRLLLFFFFLIDTLNICSNLSRFTDNHRLTLPNIRATRYIREHRDWQKTI